MAEVSPEKSYKLSSLEQLKKLLQENGWNDSKITNLFWGIDGVNDPFKERELSEAQLKALAAKLDSLKTKYEQRLILNQFALGTLIEDIGKNYIFKNLIELRKAIEEQWVVYPVAYLEQPNSSFVSSFASAKPISKERFDTLITDLKAISGSSATDDAKRGELIRVAFWGVESVKKVANTQSSDQEANIKKDLGILANNELPANFPNDLDTRLTFISEQITRPNLTESEKELFKSYLEALLSVSGFNYTSDTRNSIKKLLEETSNKKILSENEQGTEVQKALQKALDEQLKTMDGKLETMNPNEVDEIISMSLQILTLDWLKKVPGMKDKFEELRTYEPLIQGIAGATILKKLQKLGYALTFTSGNQVKVVSKNQDALELETKLNAHLQKSPALIKSLQSGMLYLSPSFHAYRTSVTNGEWKLINPESVDRKSYTAFLNRKNPSTLTPEEKAYLASERFFDPQMNFQASLTQSKDYTKLVEAMEKITGDKDVGDLLPKTGEWESQSKNSGSGWDNKLATQGGKLAGEAGKFLGTIAKTWIGGGLSFLGTMMKEWWMEGSIAIIGGILWSIFSKNGLGFWGTLGAIFGVGVLTNTDKLKDVLPNMSAHAASPSNSGNNTTPGSSWNKDSMEASLGGNDIETRKSPLTKSTLIIRALGKDNENSDIENEKGIIHTMEKMNFSQIFLTLSGKQSWEAPLRSMNFNNLNKTEQDKITAIITNQSSVQMLEKYVGYISSHPAIRDMVIDKKRGITLEQASNAIIEYENNTKSQKRDVELAPWIKAVPDHIPSIASIMKEGEAYGDLIVLARMVEYGYLPKLNYTAGEVLGSAGFVKKIIKGAVWVWLGGPLTNNTPGANWFSGKYKHYETDFLKSLQALIDAEEKELQKKSVAWNADKTSFAPLEEEINARKAGLEKLQSALNGGNPEEIKAALKEYRTVAKTPWYSHIWKRAEKVQEFSKKEQQKIAEIERIGKDIDTAYREMETTRQAAMKEGATEVEKQAAIDATRKYNDTLVELQKTGVKSLSELPSAVRSQVISENIWAMKIAKVNGGLETFSQKLGTLASTKGGKWILWVGVIGLFYNNKNSLLDLWEKWEYTTLGKAGYDFIAGAVPWVSTFHETLMLSNGFGFWYRDMILGEGYKMSTTEKAFRVAGAVPFGWMLTKTAGKWVLLAGEHMGINALRTGWKIIEWASDMALTGIKPVMQIATYGTLGYSTYEMAYNLFG